MLNWHCVISRPQQEARAGVELANQGFRVFLPIMGGKPMFPRYLFSEFDVDRDNWGVIRSTRGCTDILKNGFTPATVPTRVIEALMSYRPAPEPVQTETAFAHGQTIRVVEGPLSGLEGLFDRDANKRTQAMIEILGKRIEVPKASIRAA